jgi:hypothetical protein
MPVRLAAERDLRTRKAREVLTIDPAAPGLT